MTNADRIPGLTHRQALVLVLLSGFVLRTGFVVCWQSHLNEDRDGYVMLGQAVAHGSGYSSPRGEPTAFRPPVYPLMLAALFCAGAGSVGIGALHVILGTATVWLTWYTGHTLKFGNRAALLAALLVAVDPLLLVYATFPMTETVCAFLAALLLVVVRLSGSAGMFIMGIVFGLCVLSRPTFWAFASLAIFAKLTAYAVSRRPRRDTPVVGSGIAVTSASRFPVSMLAAALGVATIVGPWAVRNHLVLGHSVLTTTHGGYTLLLGNNLAFYRDVVSADWGTTWSEERLRLWERQRITAQVQDGLDRDDEVARDRWNKQRALASIRSAPADFAAAAWLRLRRFWNPVPLGEGYRSVPRTAVWLTGTFYMVESAAVLVFCMRARSGCRRDWWLLLLLIVSFSLVHLFYWSNARMRAPVIPAIAVLASSGLVGRYSSTESSE